MKAEQPYKIYLSNPKEYYCVGHGWVTSVQYEEKTLWSQGWDQMSLEYKLIYPDGRCTVGTEDFTPERYKVFINSGEIRVLRSYTIHKNGKMSKGETFGIGNCIIGKQKDLMRYVEMNFSYRIPDGANITLNYEHPVYNCFVIKKIYEQDKKYLVEIINRKDNVRFYNGFIEIEIDENTGQEYSLSALGYILSGDEVEQKIKSVSLILEKEDIRRLQYNRDFGSSE